MRDRINLKGIECYAYHGVYEEERINGQNFFVDATLFLDTREAGRSDNLSLSVDYAALAVFIKEYVEEHEFKLLEALAEGLARAILIKYHKAEKLVQEDGYQILEGGPAALYHGDSILYDIDFRRLSHRYAL